MGRLHAHSMCLLLSWEAVTCVGKRGAFLLVDQGQGVIPHGPTSCPVQLSSSFPVEGPEMGGDGHAWDFMKLKFYFGFWILIRVFLPSQPY